MEAQEQYWQMADSLTCQTEDYLEAKQELESIFKTELDPELFDYLETLLNLAEEALSEYYFTAGYRQAKESS